MDVDEVGHHTVPQDDDYYQGLNIDAVDLGLHHPVPQQSGQSHAKGVCQQSVEEHYGLAASEELGGVAEDLAVPGRVAVGNSSQVDISIGIIPDQIKEAAAAFGEHGAARGTFRTGAFGIAPQGLEQKVHEVKESIEERTTHH